MNKIALDLLEFEPYSSMTEWFKRYGSSVRVKANVAGWTPYCGMEIMTHKTEAWLPWYRGGDYTNGKPVRAKLGKAPAICRLPAVKLCGRFLLLDGCHRLVQVKPRFILLDYLKAEKKDAWRFQDFGNPFWAALLKRI